MYFSPFQVQDSKTQEKIVGAIAMADKVPAHGVDLKASAARKRVAGKTLQTDAMVLLEA